MFTSPEVVDAWVDIQSFILTTYMFVHTFVDFLLNIILPIEGKTDISDEYVSDSGEQSKRQRLRKLRRKISRRHLSPTPSP